MVRSILLGAPVVVIVLLLRGSDPTALSVAPTTVVARVAAVEAFVMPAPPPTTTTTTTVPPTTTTAPPPPPTEAPTTAPPETAPPDTSPPATEAPAAPAPPKPKKTTTTAEAPPATDPPDTAPPDTAPPDTSPPPPPVAIPGDASAVISLTNQERAAAGLAPLNANSALHAAAQRESNDMAANTTMSHTGSDGSTVATRASAAGYSWHAIGENLAVGYTSASGVMAGWMNSAGHRANILNAVYQDIGVAVATGPDGKKYWTMVVGA